MLPHKIFIVGMPGCGKTTMAQKLGKKLGYDWLDLDQLIEQHTGETITGLFEEKGEAAFRALESKVLQTSTQNRAQFILACGGGTPCFHGNMDFIRRNGCSIYLKTDTSVLTDRLGANRDRPLINTNRVELHNYVGKLLKERAPYYEQARIIWDSKHSPDLLIKALQQAG